MKPVTITSSTTTFLYYWNTQTNSCVYQSYLFQNSQYPSKFCPYPNVPIYRPNKRNKTIQPSPKSPHPLTIGANIPK